MGIVIGLAFAAVITALVADLITPLIAAIGGNPDFSRLTFTINSSKFFYGSFVNALITFVVIAAVVFFLVVKPVNALMDRRKTELPVETPTRQCPGVPERHPRRGKTVRLLHSRGSGLAGTDSPEGSAQSFLAVAGRLLHERLEHPQVLARLGVP